MESLSLDEQARRRRAIIGACATVVVVAFMCGVAVWVRLEASPPGAGLYAPLPPLKPAAKKP